MIERLLDIQNIQEFVLNDPALSAGLLVLIYIGIRWQRTLPYREYRMWHLVKIFVFRRLDKRLTALGRPLIHPKHRPENSDEFITTLPDPPRMVFEELRSLGASPHLICTVKSRPGVTTGVEYTHSQLVMLNDDGTQTEYYLFYNDGSTDVYGHRETAVTDPQGHVSDAQTAAKLPEDLRG